MQVKEIMSKDPITVAPEETAEGVARLMKKEHIGAVLVAERDTKNLRGIITDRDLVTRTVAEGEDPGECLARDFCTDTLHSISPEYSLEQAAEEMREASIRRLPVTEDGHAVGIVSLGDLAEEKDPHSVLGEISHAKANN